MIRCSGDLFWDPISEQTCLDCALRLKTPPCGFSYPLLKAMFNGQEDRTEEIHVTDLTQCLLKAYYDKTDPEPEYVHLGMYKMLGKAVHAYMEQAVKDDPNIEAEVEISDAGIDGRIDAVMGDDIIDFKTTGYIVENNLPYGNHAEQVNLYRQMAKKEGNLYIQYVSMQGPPRCQKKNGYKPCNTPVVMQDGVVLCPKCGTISKQQHLGAKIVDIDVENVDYMQERAEKLKAAMESGTPPDAEPGWLCSYCPHLKKCTVGQIYMEME
ncbi:MAG TPA: PD-(D/E)XK nuclease family protein [Bellilinea sp.]|nr:PD-(D/E)XK nuclease family protein [Bellilinea sp.]